MKIPAIDFRSATRWISGRREIPTPVENRICEHCGKQREPEQTSGPEVVANILCACLFLAILIPGCYFINSWIDRIPRLIHPVIWQSPHDDWSPY